MATKSGIPRSTLDKGTAARIEALLVVGADNLTDGDKAFLRARADYLSEAEREDLGINTDDGDTPTNEDDEVAGTDEEPAAKPKAKPKGKKK